MNVRKLLIALLVALLVLVATADAAGAVPLLDDCFIDPRSANPVTCRL